MSDQLNHKQNGAMRLFEAMSGVDEKYLAACEDYKKIKPKGVVVFMQKYGKAMAAVLCLAVLGAGYAGMQQFAGVDKSATTMEAEMAAPAGSAPAMQEAEAEEALREENWAEESLDKDIAVDGAMQNGISAGSSYFDEKQNAVGADSVMSETEHVPVEDKNNSETKVESGASLRGLTLEETGDVAVVGKYVPNSWPEDGVLVNAWCSENVGAEYILLLWRYGDAQDGFAVRVENLGVELPEWAASEIESGYIVYEEDFDKEFVRSRVQVPDADHVEGTMPEGEFGVVYKEGHDNVLVYFEGRCDVDDIWEMMQ